MKKSIGEIMSDPRIWEMSEEEKLHDDMMQFLRTYKKD